jgi:hypothetical protein
MEERTNSGDSHEGSPDRVRANTAPEINLRLDAEAEERVRRSATLSAEQLSRRIAELDREWDMERLLEMNASVLAFSGVGLAAASRNKKWLIIPGIVLPFLFQHAVQGWCPPVPLLRRLGVRSREEIDREKYALKVLRGDFEGTHGHAAADEKASDALSAVKV